MRVLTLLLIALPVTGSLFAQEGKAIVPTWEKYWNSSNEGRTVLYVSNISSETITFYLNLYDENGNAYTEATETADDNIYITGAIVGDPTESGGATLGPNESGKIVLRNGSLYYGYGDIRWTCTQNIQVAMVASLMNLITGSDGKYSRAMFGINEHRPF